MRYKPHIQKGDMFWKAWSKEHSYFSNGVEVFPCAFGDTPEKAYRHWLEMMNAGEEKVVVWAEEGYDFRVGWICVMALILSFPLSFVLLCFVLK